MAAVAVGVVTPLALWLVREWPADVGQVPDGERHAEAAQANDALREVDRRWTTRAWSLSAAVREPRFWLAVVSGAGSNVSPQIAFIHGPALLVDAGYDVLSAALVIGASGFVIIGGTIMWGWLSDRAGREVAFSLGLGCQIVSMLLLAIASRTVSALLAASLAVFIGLGYAVLTPLIAAVAADMFRGPRFGAIYGVFIAASASLGGLTAWLAGFVFDRTGSYLPVILGAVVVNVLAAVGMWIAAPRRVRLAPGRVHRPPAGAGL
jgi:MFS family permease